MASRSPRSGTGSSAAKSCWTCSMAPGGPAAACELDTTSCPAAVSAATRCRPMNPVPPVSRMRTTCPLALWESVGMRARPADSGPVPSLPPPRRGRVGERVSQIVVQHLADALLDSPPRRETGGRLDDSFLGAAGFTLVLDSNVHTTGASGGLDG